MSELRTSARELVDKYRSQANDEITGGYTRELVGTIIGWAIPGSRRALTEKLEQEATEACAPRARARDAARPA